MVAPAVWEGSGEGSGGVDMPGVEWVVKAVVVWWVVGVVLYSGVGYGPVGTEKAWWAEVLP